MPDARVDRYVESVRWYIRLPAVGTGLEREHIRALFEALPDLMKSFRDRLARDLAASAQLQRRIPPALQDAYRNIK